MPDSAKIGSDSNTMLASPFQDLLSNLFCYVFVQLQVGQLCPPKLISVYFQRYAKAVKEFLQLQVG